MKTRCGYVAILGRPNVGKSTLLNRILGQKLCITSRKPQTTRHQILGLKTTEHIQAIYVDTPGIHKNAKKALNRYMNKAATSVIHDVDLILWLTDGAYSHKEDQILQQLKTTKVPVILVINKIDQIKQKSALLETITIWQQQFDFAEIIPISATLGDQVSTLEGEVERRLPQGPFFYEQNQLTDKSDRFIASEIVREKLMRGLGEELPYALTVVIEQFKQSVDSGQLEIAATIYVERPTQKAIVIGKQGKKLKAIGIEARLAMNDYFDCRVHLELWVKVKAGWSDSEQSLRNLGYDS